MLDEREVLLWRWSLHQIRDEVDYAMTRVKVTSAAIDANCEFVQPGYLC